MAIVTMCPVCVGRVKFETWRGRPQERCPRCKALKRHRQDWLFLKRVLQIEQARGRMLHTAPEHGLYKLLNRLPYLDYTTCDIVPSKSVMHQVDLTNCERYTDDSFDYIYSSHVLEHIADLSAALHQLYRISKPGGCAILQVPLRDGPTFVHPEAVDRESRKRFHGHPDHKRWPGREDWHVILAEPGWSVTIARVGDFATANEANRFAVNLGSPVYVCKK